MEGLFKVVEINHPNHPLMVSLSNHRRPSFDRLTTSGGRRTVKGPAGDGGGLEFVEHLLQLGAVGGDSQAQHEQ